MNRIGMILFWMIGITLMVYGKEWMIEEGEVLGRLADQEQRAAYHWATDLTDANGASAQAAATALLQEWGQALRTRSAHTYSSTPPQSLRMMQLLNRLDTPPIADAAQQQELLALRTGLETFYSEGNVTVPCRNGAAGTCAYPLEELQEGLANQSESEAWKKAAWTAWHNKFVPERSAYERLVALGNVGAATAGFDNLAKLWRSWYDLSDAKMLAMERRMWAELSPLYSKLHCYVYRKLVAKYGSEPFASSKGAIPAHLLGDMWAQDWSALYEELLPSPDAGSLAFGSALRSVERMRDFVLQFYQSAGFPSPPASFADLSMWTRPAGRDVVCHASAWDLGTNETGTPPDVRIKMCAQAGDEGSFRVMFHEMGHIMYYLLYAAQPSLFRQGANPGFHEAVGDAMLLSITPDYLRQAMDIDVPEDEALQQGLLLNQLMRTALTKVAFLPFGMLVDRWRWAIFEGEGDLQELWWHLRGARQGISLPEGLSARFSDEGYFDAGAKYHVAANVPYFRYFFATVLQFQLHRDMCRAMGFDGPLANCSIYNRPDAAASLRAMLSLGASVPWQAALAALGGKTPESLDTDAVLDTSAMIEYFAPLSAWLDAQNGGSGSCQWQPVVEVDVLVNQLWIELSTEIFVYIFIFAVIAFIALAVVAGIYIRRRQKAELFNDEKEALSRAKEMDRLSDLDLEEDPSSNHFRMDEMAKDSD